MGEFDGLAALVTGGASGIGATTVALLHSGGAQVGILDRDTDGANPHALTVRCDVTDRAAVEAVAAVAGRFGGGMIGRPGPMAG